MLNTFSKQNPNFKGQYNRMYSNRDFMFFCCKNIFKTKRNQRKRAAIKLAAPPAPPDFTRHSAPKNFLGRPKNFPGRPSKFVWGGPETCWGAPTNFLGRPKKHFWGAPRPKKLGRVVRRSAGAGFRNVIGCYRNVIGIVVACCRML